MNVSLYSQNPAAHREWETFVDSPLQSRRVRMRSEPSKAKSFPFFREEHLEEKASMCMLFSS